MEIQPTAGNCSAIPSPVSLLSGPRMVPIPTFPLLHVGKCSVQPFRSFCGAEEPTQVPQEVSTQPCSQAGPGGNLTLPSNTKLLPESLPQSKELYLTKSQFLKVLTQQSHHLLVIPAGPTPAEEWPSTLFVYFPFFINLPKKLHHFPLSIHLP